MLVLPSLAASAAIHVDWSRQLLSALQYLHALGPPLVVHLDVKPGNILLSGDGRQLRLCDFGSCHRVYCFNLLPANMNS